MKPERPTRRDMFRAGGALAAASVTAPGNAAAAKAAEESPGVYTRIGVKPFINLTATYTINGGTLTLPEVKEAMDQASRYSVNLDELMEKAGERLATLLGTEGAMVTAGAASALALATAACVAGADPEKMAQLPNVTGLKDEVIMPRQSRNVYDHAMRTTGVRVIEIDSAEDFHAALGRHTAMVAVLGTSEAAGKIRLEEMAAAAHKLGVPVVVDAAAELPVKPHPYLSRGADLVCHSGGKILRGPQCAGLLLGRRDLVRAAWLNSAPHHASGRGMKVGKEEIMGMLAAIETWVNKRDIQAEYRTWEGWYAHISKRITEVPGIRTQVLPAKGASPFPVLEVTWDAARIGITAGELGRMLLEGEPRIMSHAEGDGHSFLIRPAAMKPEHYPLVAERLYDLFRQAQPARAAALKAPAAVDLSGTWEAELGFAYGASLHRLVLQAQGNQVSGIHLGRTLRGNVSGWIDGARVEFHSALPVEGVRLTYAFRGTVANDQMSGEVDLGEYGHARFTARRTS